MKEIVQITAETFEKVLEKVRESEVIDLRECTFIDPYGMVGILEIGELLKSEGIQKLLHLPRTGEVLTCLERMDFFRFADGCFMLEPPKPEIPSKYRKNSSADVMLEITPVEKPDDIRFVVSRIKERAPVILKEHLHYDEKAIRSFIVALSEVCENIIEHSKNKGFVGIQKYHFHNMKKNVVNIAVMDIGIGFTRSLSGRFLLRNDLHGIEKALLHGASRYVEEGRGHGLAAVKHFVAQSNGKLTIRSGTAKMSIIPKWARGREKELNLTPFRGVQIDIVLPEV